MEEVEWPVCCTKDYAKCMFLTSKGLLVHAFRQGVPEPNHPADLDNTYKVPNVFERTDAIRTYDQYENHYTNYNWLKGQIRICKDCYLHFSSNIINREDTNLKRNKSFSRFDENPSPTKPVIMPKERKLKRNKTKEGLKLTRETLILEKPPTCKSEKAKSRNSNHTYDSQKSKSQKISNFVKSGQQSVNASAKSGFRVAPLQRRKKRIPIAMRKGTLTKTYSVRTLSTVWSPTGSRTSSRGQSPVGLLHWTSGLLPRIGAMSPQQKSEFLFGTIKDLKTAIREVNVKK